MTAVPLPDPGHDGEQPPRPDAAARGETPSDAAPQDAIPSVPAERDVMSAGGAVRGGRAGLAGGVDGEDGWDADAAMARLLDDVEAGRVAVPPDAAAGLEHGPAVMFTLGEAADVDPAELARMCGPEGLAGECFAADRPADAMRPGPLLCVLAEQAVAEADSLTGNQLLGVVAAARRLRNRAEYLELAAIGAYARRGQAAYRASVAAGARPGRRDGEFAAAELAMELLVSERAAGDRMDFAADLAARLPATFGGLAAGVIDGDKAWVIWSYTRFLSGADAAQADAVLAGAAPGVRYDTLARRAARLEMRLDPAGVAARKEHARAERRRVEARLEASGNMCYGARELTAAEALAARAGIDAGAVALRRAGVPGSLGELQVLVFLDRMAGRDPLDRARRQARTGPAAADPGGGDSGGAAGRRAGPDGNPPEAAAGDRHGPWYEDDADGDEDPARPGEPAGPEDSTRADGGPADGGPGNGGPGNGGRADGGHGVGGPADPGSPAGSPAPLPALINLVVTAGTLFGWSTAPGDAGTWGLLGPDDTRAIVHAASQHPRTRWCLTVTDGADGTAVAHGCSRGPHPWTPATGGRDGPATGGRDGHATGGRDGPASGGPEDPASGGRDDRISGGRDGPARPGDGTRQAGPDEHQQAQLAELLRALNVTLAPIARGICDHRHREDRYTPSRKLKHLVRARTATCPAPGCGGQACHSDLDHTLAWPDGPTDECNLSPACRRHHRVKQAPGWHLEQPEPGVMRWTTPSGRTHLTRPTQYDL